MEYGLTVTDAHSKYRWFARLQTKDQAAQAIINIVRNAQTQLGCKVKRLYADGGTEFVNQTLKALLRARRASSCTIRRRGRSSSTAWRRTRCARSKDATRTP